ncbi:hypothetical protein SAMN05444351_3091 [Geodermatophilus nigrescens]|uniref:Uncharacterized protein n=1 Tax=Geodermatophilus nigrescens TaxID=1070870 RepID=A0A1M5M9P8_9ACTN|nr:hypothetical protein SAMN05444351_3091 [Geodermatophilus nigrescens]
MITVSMPSTDSQVREIAKDPNGYVAKTRKASLGRSQGLKRVLRTHVGRKRAKTGHSTKLS